MRIGVEALALIALGPLLLSARSLAWAPVAGLAMLVAARLLVGNALLPKPVALPLGLWLITLCAAVALGAQVAPAAAWSRFWAFAYGVVACGAVVNASDAAGPRVARLILPGWLAVVAIIGAVGLYIVASDFANKIPFLSSVLAGVAGQALTIQNSFRAEDGLNPNVLAGVLLPAMYAPAALALALRGRTGASRAAGIAAAVAAGAFLAGVLLLTQSRGGYIGFAVGVIAFAAFRNRRTAWAAAALSVGALALAAGVLPLTSIDWRDYANGRFELWSRAWLLLQTFPLTGTGLNMFKPVSELLYPSLLAGEPSLIHAHNMLLQLALDYGAFGLVAALWTMAGVWMAGLRALRAPLMTTDRFACWSLRALLAGQVALFVYNLTDYSNFGSKQAFVFWMAWGLILALAHAARNDASTAEVG